MPRTVFATRLLAIGLVLMVGFWAIAGVWLAQFAALSSDYNASCTPPVVPLRDWPPATCADLSARMGEASAIAFVGGVVGFVGVVIALIGVTREPRP